MSFRRRILSGAVVVLLVPAATAQPERSLAAGARVRVTAPAGKGRLIGTLVAFETDRLVLDVQGALERQVVLRSDVTKLELSQGRKRKTMKGAWIGLATGAIAGGLLAAAYASSDGGPENAGFVPSVAAVYGAGGMGLGALIGSLMKSERWREIDLARPLVTVEPVPGGAALAVRIPVGR